MKDNVVHVHPFIFAAAKRVGANALAREYNLMFGQAIESTTMKRYLGGGRGYEKGPPKLVKAFLIQRFVRW